MAIKLIVGLRNPGANYDATRHNAGGWFVASLAKHFNISFKQEKKLQAEIGTTLVDGYACRVMLPLTYMNHSGRAVQAVTHFFDIKPQEVLIAHDELDLPTGKIKLKSSGGHSGHNGLRDVMQQLKTRDFHRLRIGIGHPGHKDAVLNYVLGKPSPMDKQCIDEAIEQAVSIMPIIMAGDMAAGMNALHLGS